MTAAPAAKITSAQDRQERRAGKAITANSRYSEEMLRDHAEERHKRKDPPDTPMHLAIYSGEALSGYRPVTAFSGPILTAIPVEGT